MNMPDTKSYMPRGFANSTLDVLNPERSVIVDMVMVQFISAIIVILAVVLFKANELPASSMSYYIVGLFGCALMLTGVYSRIVR